MEHDSPTIRGTFASACVGLLWAVLKWGFDHFLWDALFQFLESKFGLKEANALTSVVSNVAPALLAIGALRGMYFLARRPDAPKPVKSVIFLPNERPSPRVPQRRFTIKKAASVILIALVLIAAVIGQRGRIFAGHSAAGTGTVAEARSLTLKDLFESDWPQLASFYGVVANNGQLRMHWRLNADFDGREKFFMVYVDMMQRVDDAQAALEYFGNNCENLVGDVDKVVNLWGIAPGGTQPTYLRDMVFSKRVYVYYENPEFALERRAAITAEYRQHGLFVEFRDHSYAIAHQHDSDWRIAGPLMPGTLILPDIQAIKGYAIRFDNLGPGYLSVVTRKDQTITARPAN